MYIDDNGARENALRRKLRTTVSDWLDDSHESAVDVINVLAETIHDISSIYFGEQISVKVFENFVEVVKRKGGLRP